jgi:light-regulated signal transduction histidine kinase (bacteriophytochrome)
METADELQDRDEDVRAADGTGVQSGAYLLELSLDWIVLRASENIHQLLRESHLTLIEEPLGKFVQAQALHDLRNLFSRLSGTTGVARAYAVRLTGEPDLVDIAFQQADGCVLLEAVPSAGCFGEYFGTVGGLVDGLSNARGPALLDGGARRMRALTGYDRVALVYGEERAESSRGALSAPATLADDLPGIVADAEARPVAVFPRASEGTSVGQALMRSCSEQSLQALRAEGVRALLRIRFSADGVTGEFRCDCRTPQAPNFELHAAAELFAQLFAMQLELDRLRS